MSKLLEFFLGSILITVFTVAFMFFSALHYILSVGGIGDCVWYGSVRTWIDSNGDGRLNHGETPLSDVNVHIVDVENRRVDVGWSASTDQDGDVQLSIPIPGCSETVFEMYVDIPEGYRMTTRPRIEAKPNIWGSPSTENIYYFGFISEK